MNKNWFPMLNKQNINEPIIFCFYHAGGNANVFNKWVRNASKANIIPVEIPGHGRRRCEPCMEDIRKIASSAAKEISIKAQDSRFIFWGHSMGALFAFETAYYLEKIYFQHPEVLIVSGRQAPDSNYKGMYTCSQGQGALVNDIKRLGLISQELLNSDEYMNMVIPMIYNDYKINEEYVYKNEVVNVPIIAHYGNGDIEATENRLKEWKNMTSKHFYLQGFDGDHFYIFNEDVNYLNELENITSNYIN